MTIQPNLIALQRRTLLILTGRLGGGCLLRRCALGLVSSCALTGWGRVLRTASASISCSLALLGAEDFVISQLFLFRLCGFPSQALSLQSFVIFQEGCLRFFVFRCCLPFTEALSSASRLQFREVFACSIAHGSPPISVTSKMTIALQRCPARKPGD